MCHNKLKLVSIILILLISGCIKKEKDELTLPVRIKLQIATHPLIEDYYLSAYQAEIGIQSIEFEGRREAGEDIFFKTDPKMNLQTGPFSSSPTRILEFDIPQGVYNYMKWDVTLKRIVIEELNSIDDPDSLNIGLVIPGSYWTDEWELTITRFIFAIDETELLSFKTNGIAGSSSIVISENKDYEITLLLDLRYTFGSVSRESFEEAELSDVYGDQVILITSNNNKNLYENFLYRINQSTKVSIK